MDSRHRNPSEPGQRPFFPRDSLRLRILLALTVAFLGLLVTAVLALDWNLRRSLELAQDDVLQAQLLGLVAAAEYEPDSQRLAIREAADRRLLVPGAELVAEIRPASEGPAWRSGSALGLDFTPPLAIPRGEALDWTEDFPEGRRLAFRTLHLDWEHAGQTVGSYRFTVGQDLAPWQAQYRAFRLGLVSTFALIAVLALFLFGGVLHRALRPLQRIETEIREIEAGQRQRLSEASPVELHRVVRNLNALLEREHGRQRRYQEALANLAHSLKTPLAAARHRLLGIGTEPRDPDTGSVDRDVERQDDGAERQDRGDERHDHRGRQVPAEREIGRAVDAELERMDRIISWHLRRVAAPTALPGPPGQQTPVAEACADLVATLHKVHADRTLHCDIELDDRLHFFGDPDDLYEILGNLLDNAFKHARRRIRITREPQPLPGQNGLRIQDDGPGLTPEDAARALQRTQRLDEHQPGQGIGLATAHEILLAYGGDLNLRRAEEGGLVVSIGLPRELLC